MSSLGPAVIDVGDLHALLTLGLLGSVLLAAGYVVFFRPIILVRVPLWILCHTIYRLRGFGGDNIPANGPALLVCNHVSYLDWLFIMAGQKRHIQFVIFAGWTKVWGLRHLLKWAGVIPIDKWAGPRAIVQSLKMAGAALKRGEVVCIFAEGRFTRTGFLLPFHRGFEQIVKHHPAPIIPVCLEQVWGSIFSYRGGKLIWKWPLELPYPVTISYGQPMAATARAVEVRLAIQKLSADSALERTNRRPLVHRRFARLAARHPFRPCLIDPLVRKKPLSYGTVLVEAVCLARQWRPLLAGDAMVGVWLPPSAPAAVVNIALAMLGKTAVNLNYASSAEAVQTAARQCSLRHVITAKSFSAQVKLEAGPGVDAIFLEDSAERISRLRKMATWLSVLALPGVVLERWVLGLGGHKPGDLAAVLFTSDGDPKGVMLTHANIAANAESMIQAVDVRSSDRLVGVLPLFQAFGYTATLWLPLQVGASVVFAKTSAVLETSEVCPADPGQGREIGALCRTKKASIFLTTPDLLRLCLTTCQAGDFASLRLLMCGADLLPQALAQEFKEKFGVLPLQGYGRTELSPAAAVNVPDQDMDGFRQVGNKPGTIGQPLPGMTARIIHSETFAPLPPGQEGLLLIYGANVMAGYLGRPEATKEAVRDGWFVTGALAKFDEDGFITLPDR